MLITHRRIVAVGTFLLALGSTCAVAASHELRIEHVTLVSPERPAPMRDATIRIKDDRIVAITQGSLPKDRSGQVETIDGSGLYLSPGLIDTHVHTSDPPGFGESQARAHPDLVRSLREQAPRSYLYFGYTTLLDLFSTREHLEEWNAQPIHPDLYFCGGAQIPGGYPQIQYVGPEDRAALYRYMLVQPGEEGKAPEGVDPKTHTPAAIMSRMKSDGARCVKTFYERGFGETDEMPAPRVDTIRELVKAAHAIHMPVFIHANGTDAQEFAVSVGADVIVHGLWHWNREQNATELTPRAQKILDGVLQAKMGWQPTMQVLYGLQDVFDPAYLADPALAHVVPASVLQWYRSQEGQWFHDILAQNFFSKSLLDSHDAQRQWNEARAVLARPIARDRNATRYMAAHGAKILFGTDTPSAPTYANQPGLNGLREMQHLAEAGLTPLQILRAATQSNATALGLEREIGTVEPGKRANLLLLRADPTQTLDAYDQIVKVIVRGQVFDRAELGADGAPPR